MTDPNARVLTRVRVTFSKSGALRYIGHLDLHSILERSLRRARLPLAYSQGFHPQPRLQLASALPLGMSSDCEMLDVWLDAPPPLMEIATALQGAVPPDLRISHLEIVPTNEPALQNRVTSAEYTVELRELPAGYDLPAAVAALLAAESLPRIWRNKTYDLRLLIEELSITDAAEAQPHRLHLRLAARAGATGRPEEVISALGLNPLTARCHRSRLILQDLVPKTVEEQPAA